MFENIKNKIEDGQRSKNGLEVLDKDLVKFLGEKHKDNLDKYNTARRELLKYFDDLELRPELLQDKTALDLGSNKSFFDEYCKEKYNTNFVALDYSDKYLGTKHDLGVRGDAKNLPFKDESFDLIISHSSMPHLLIKFEKEMQAEGKLSTETKERILQDLLKLFREIYRATKQKGQIRMDTFCEKEKYTSDLSKDKEQSLLYEYQLLRIDLMKEALDVFEKESGARCMFKDEEKGGLIIILK